MIRTSILLLLLAATCTFTACKKDDPAPKKNITRIELRLNTPGFVETFQALDSNNDGTWETIDDLVLPALTGDISCEIRLLDASQTPVADLTTEVEAESNTHLFTFEVSGADLGIKPNDTAADGKPFNLKTLWDAEEVSNGSVRVRLHHNPSDKSANEPGGEIDLDVMFVVKIQ